MILPELSKARTRLDFETQPFSPGVRTGKASTLFFGGPGLSINGFVVVSGHRAKRRYFPGTRRGNAPNFPGRREDVLAVDKSKAANDDHKLAA